MAWLKYDRTGTRWKNHNTKISLLTSTCRPKRFKDFIKRLTDTCSNPDVVEILVKVDTEDAPLQVYQEHLLASPFSHKLLCFPKLNGYWSVYVFLNELGKLAKGDIYWFLCDEIVIQSTDWVDVLLNTRDIYSDNIYLFNPRGTKIHPKYTAMPAVSKEWFSILGFGSPFPELDVFLIKLAMRLQRFHVGDMINFNIDPQSWRLHDRSAFKKGRNWGRVKRAMHEYIEARKHLFLDKMTDPLVVPNPIDWKW